MPLHDEPKFETVFAPKSYAWATDSSVRYAAVTAGGEVIGYLWAAVTDDAGNFVRRRKAGAKGANAEVAWVQRLRQSCAEGLTPLEALGRWAGEPEDELAGYLPPGTEHTAPSLAALEELAQR